MMTPMLNPFYRYFVIAIIFFNSLSYSTAENSFFLDQIVQESLLEKMNDFQGFLEISYSANSNIDKIRAKEDGIKAVIIEKINLKYNNFSAKILYNQGGSDIIYGYYVAYIELPTAGKNIKQGDIIQNSDIQYVKTKLKEAPKTIALSADEIVGMQAKRHIAFSSFFRNSDLSKVLVIKVNDPVNIVYSSGSINLKTLGIALGSGSIGDMIKVKNESSGAMILGQITNKNTVQVNGE